MPYQKIILSLAGKAEESNVIREAVRLKKLLNADLSVLHVNDPAAGRAYLMMDSLPLVTEADIREMFRQSGFPREAGEIRITIVEGESCTDEIANATHQADLLIVGHRRKNKFLAAFIDSTDERVFDMVSCPILVVPMK